MTVQRTHAVSLRHVRIRDCMHNGILSCPPDAPLSAVAEIMARHHVHAVVVAQYSGARPLGVISDLDVVTAAISGEAPSAGEVAVTETLTVSGAESLHRAAQLMSDHGVSHLIVADSASGYPAGILSTLDVAAVCADCSA